VGGIRKRRQRQCKVCTIRKTVSSKRQVTRFYCPKCSNGSKRVYLCDKVRQDHYPNNNLTCYEIWHQLWRNGSERVSRCEVRGRNTEALTMMAMLMKSLLATLTLLQTLLLILQKTQLHLQRRILQLR
ncbi:hypothetical protein PHMEG_00032715, partial [Phytophthora megakarya]